MEGDGIGPEITAATMNVLAAADDAFGLGLSFASIAIGLAALRSEGKTLSERAIEAAKKADGVILGPVSHNEYPPLSQGGLNPSGELRKRLDLFANIRPARSRGGFPPRCGAPVDLVIVRENTEGFYAIALCSSVPASSCQRRISRSQCARLRGRARRGSRRRHLRSRQGAARK